MSGKPEVRLLAAYPSRWGPGRVHAAIYFRHRLWDRGWFPICTRDHIHASEAVKVGRRDLVDRVTCRHCLRVLAAQGFRPRATTQGNGRPLHSVVAADEIASGATDLGHDNVVGYPS